MTPVPRHAPLYMALFTLACIGILIWGLILSRPKPKPATLYQVNPTLYKKSEWAYTLRREMRGEQR